MLTSRVIALLSWHEEVRTRWDGLIIIPCDKQAKYDKSRCSIYNMDVFKSLMSYSPKSKDLIPLKEYTSFHSISIVPGDAGYLSGGSSGTSDHISNVSQFTKRETS